MGNNSIPKFIFRLSRFPVYRGSILGRFYSILLHAVFQYVFSDHVSERNSHHNDSGNVSVCSVQSNVSLQTDLPTECLPTYQHTKTFSPHCIMSHKVPSVSERLLTGCACVWLVTSVNYKLWYSRPLI